MSQPDTALVLDAQPTTLASWAKAVCNAIDAQGIDSHQLLLEAAIEPDQLNDPEGRILVSKMSRLWTLAVAATGNEAFGLCVPQFVQPTSFHALGFSWMVSDTLREAWHRAQRYYQIVSNVLTIEIQEGPDESAFCYVKIPGQTYAKEAIDAFSATMISMAMSVSAGQLRPLRVELEREPPGDPASFCKYFPCDIRFSAGHNKIYFKNSDLDKSLPSANREIALKNDEVVQNYLSRLLQQSLTKQVTEKIITALTMGEPSQSLVADSLNMSSRNLQRKLKDEATSFRQLLDEVRKNLAQRYLTHSQQSIIEITYQLGFQDPSNFTRAFKRWFGMSPTAFRQQQHTTL